MKSVALLTIATIFAVGSLSAQVLEQKGSFGIVVAENFVKFNYVITYLGDSAQPDQIAFRISFDDTKGYNLAAEIDEAQTNVKNLKNQSLTGKVNRENSGSAILLFPKLKKKP